jgi:hypothetical protein
VDDMSDDPVIAALARLEAGQTKLRVDLMERMDQLQTGVDAIRDDLTVLGGSSDAVRRTNENTREEVRDLARIVGDMQRILLKHGTRLDQLERGAP